MPKGKKYSNELVELIISTYNDGKSPYWMVQNIEELKGKRPSVVYEILKREGIELRKKTPLTDEQRKGRRKYNVNDDYFDIIDSDEKAYWLGFIMADGWITQVEDKVGISLAEEDITHLEKFKQAVSSESPINHYVGKGYNSETPYVRLIITSKKMKEDLIKHGVLLQKTNILEFPYHIPKEYYHSLIRGYMDGDGCITYGGIQKCGNKKFNMKIVGTYEFITAIQKILDVESLTIAKRHKDREANNWTLTVAGNLKLATILDKIYNNSTVYLDRKHDRYLELKQQLSLSS